ncbi:PHA/PHB synthase family protein [Pelagimonas varians]|uniref:Poly-beta-hydroxybutyrate polymerase n=1 Tax=Pelagimonas varians TaxID=696760 RepID=A0A238L3Z4_9RHOB|nr:alpha/beta fold hydrolase [Pelagimonas varians]PYG26357.1 polyhydroxyalkanoate synthase [Pelagimonas varians]SMX49784.1 Poly-beta-hydroxybutyrate polymerase [Pelagimonas varians]
MAHVTSLHSRQPDANQTAYEPTYQSNRPAYTITSMEQALDKVLKAAQARFTGGLSPIALQAAFADWALHLSSAPGKQLELVEKAFDKTKRFASYTAQCAANPNTSETCITPLPQDRRFTDDAWKKYPFNAMSQAFLLHQQWWHNATTEVEGITQQHENVVEFATRQILDVFSPSNYPMTNPQILAQTLGQGGMNLVRGWQNFLEDASRAQAGKNPVGTEAFVVGRNTANTPGKVVYRNALIELIQYAPTTDKVRPEPILIVPAWIMKYYILDLGDENSLVRYLTSQGFTVFMVSWKNPDAKDRDLGLEDYLSHGVMDAINAVEDITKATGIHAMGYCLGGTLLSIAAAAMARDGDTRLKTLTLLAAQVDFTEAGELTLFINESQLTYLEDMMWEKGYLDTKQMAGAFQLLRSNDLIWSRIIHTYLMGERTQMTDLSAWNADATRMPYKMHSEYLRQLFLHNDLAEGRYTVGGRPVAISDIRTPVFMVGTERDHVAPWQSVYKFKLLSDTDVTFLLTSGGHNAGIVSEPGHPRRHYRIQTKSKDARYTDPDRWMAEETEIDGSWWPAYTDWLVQKSGDPIAPPKMGANGHEPLCDAPGTYVFQD